MLGGSTTAKPDTGTRTLTISISGAPRVGKSTLVDQLERCMPGVRLRVAEGPSPAVFAEALEPSDVAVLVVDARDPLAPETRQSAAIARTAGIRHIVLAVNHLEHVGWDRSAFETLEGAFADFASRFEFSTAVAIPICTAGGDNIAARGSHTPWYGGPSLREHFDTLNLEDGAAHLGDDEAHTLSEQFAAHIACVSDQELLPGRDYKLKLDERELTASVTAVKYRLDVDSLHRVPARALAKGEIGVCTIATQSPLTVEDFSQCRHAGRFMLGDLYSDATVAVGTVDFALRRGMNIHWQPLTVTKELRASLKQQQPCVVWLTGLSGAGKSTIANLVEGWLSLHGCHTYLLDGDNVRHGLNKDLGFTAADRVENIRRVGEVARLCVDAGLIVLCSFISPFRAERAAVRSLLDEAEFVEIHVTAPLEVCERRDPKGLYAKCRAGQLPNFTGIDSPYEEPENPDLVLDTTSAPAAELAQRVVALLQERGVVGTHEQRARAGWGL
ncbi:MAG: adenylyl-sulfate kinase [Hyphomicrobium sp.]|nr:adenylyl-sulfate kinase [Hyphomicrobium sp.]